jgi:putative nucleotidyltransferase with HDIG domain
MNLQISQNDPQNAFSRPKVDIESLVETSLPPSPDNIMRLSELLRDYNTPPRKISQALISEPMLVTRILRLANSPIYALERKINSIEGAVTTIGNKALLEMIMMTIASSAFAREIRNSVIARKIWEHSIAVAVIAREISEMLNMQGTEESFTCGLLHDIGKMILLSYDFQGFSMTLSETSEEKMLTSEEQLYGYNHAQIGALVARRWGLQEEVCYAVNYHHASFHNDFLMIVTHIIEVADIIANIKGYGLRNEDEETLSNSVSVIRLRLDEDNLRQVWSNVEGKLGEIIKSCT